MAEKDITEKHLEAYNDVAADIANVLLFGGDRLIQEEDLEDLSTPESQYRFESEQQEKRTIHEMERDVTKVWKTGNLAISIIGLENQTVQDADMPLRILAYDGESYQSELVRLKKEQGKGESGEAKRLPRYPVISLVLSFDMRHWEAARSISDAVEIPERLKPFVSDYHINIVEVAWLDPETVQQFRSDFRFVAEYFVQKRMKEHYHPSDQVIRHVDETLKLMSAITGDRRFERMYNTRILAGEDKEPKMERMLDEIEERGIRIGEARGEARGRQLEKEDNIARMADYFLREHPEMTREQAMETAASILR